jgi:arginase
MTVNIVPVPTDLGLRPNGVREGAAALLGLGLAHRLDAVLHPPLVVPAFDPTLDPQWGVPNLGLVADLAREQAARVEEILSRGGLPVVLGGDDSVIFGCLTALARSGQTGLLFLDGHTDFWDPPDGDGELSDSDLWIVTGHGPRQLAQLAGERALVRAEDCVVYGHRDRVESLAEGSQDVYEHPMLVRSLAEVRAVGPDTAGVHAKAWLERLGPGRVWLHLDADCLDDELMPAVDWRLAGGLSPDEVISIVRPMAAAGLLAGIDVTIYNPALDDSALTAGQTLADVVATIAELVVR